MNIQQFSKICGVSTATISRVLNDSPRVNPETRQHVLDTMDKYGYVPNAFARGLGLNSMKMIGLLCTDVSDMYYAKAVSFLEKKLKNKGFDVILSCTEDKLSNKKHALTNLLMKRVDAIVLAGSVFSESQDNTHITKIAEKIPVAIINGVIESDNIYCLICDEKEAMLSNIVSLYNAGCKNIAYIYDAETYSGHQKLAGFYEGLKHVGIKENQHFLKVNKSLQDVIEKTIELLTNHPEIDAIVASEDLLAVGAQKALAEKKISMPIIGFNNSIIAECATPALTSVDNMLEVLCSSTAKLISEVLKGKEAPLKTVVSAKLVERETFSINKKYLSNHVKAV